MIFDNLAPSTFFGLPPFHLLAPCLSCFAHLMLTAQKGARQVLCKHSAATCIQGLDIGTTCIAVRSVLVVVGGGGGPGTVAGVSKTTIEDGG